MAGADTAYLLLKAIKELGQHAYADNIKLHVGDKTSNTQNRLRRLRNADNPMIALAGTSNNGYPQSTLYKLTPAGERRLEMELKRHERSRKS